VVRKSGGVEAMSAAEARRVLLRAQGFGRPRPGGEVGTRQLHAAIQRLGLLQLDSVNVYERSHYQPLHARLGRYDRGALDRITFGAAGPRARYTEYWAHEAAIIPVDDLPLWRWRMAELRTKRHARPDAWVHGGGRMLDWLRRELADRGPLAASQIEHEDRRRTGPWWGWDDVKRGLEHLFEWGEVATAGRVRFERRYGLPEQVLPPRVLDTPEVPREDAIRELVRRSAVALGVGTLGDLRDYHRLRATDVRGAIADLEASGELVPVAVAGWREPVWRHRDARHPRRVEAAALLSPFDPIVWDRTRAERHFGFRYRIEIYTPAHQRVYGYYSLPILLDERLVGRIDLKSDRQAGVLRVQSAWREDGPVGAAADPARIAELVRDAAAWQGLDGISVGDRGTLAAELRARL